MIENQQIIDARIMLLLYHLKRHELIKKIVLPLYDILPFLVTLTLFSLVNKF